MMNGIFPVFRKIYHKNSEFTFTGQRVILFNGIRYKMTRSFNVYRLTVETMTV